MQEMLFNTPIKTGEKQGKEDINDCTNRLNESAEEP